MSYIGCSAMECVSEIEPLLKLQYTSLSAYLPFVRLRNLNIMTFCAAGIPLGSQNPGGGTLASVLVASKTVASERVASPAPLSGRGAPASFASAPSRPSAIVLPSDEAPPLAPAPPVPPVPPDAPAPPIPPAPPVAPVPAVAPAPPVAPVALASLVPSRSADASPEQAPRHS